MSLRRFLFVISLSVVPGILAFSVRAADAPLTWSTPTTYTDGTPMPASAIVGYDIRYGLCAADKKSIANTPTVVSAPASPRTVTGLGSGIWCFQVSTKTADAQSPFTVDSATGLLAWKQIILIPSPPPSVSVGGGVGIAYMILRQNDRFVALPVGTVAPNTQCDTANGSIAGGVTYYTVPSAAVTWSGSTRPTVVVAKCS